MNNRKLLMVLLGCLSFQALRAQQADTCRWWNPAAGKFTAIRGQGWPGKTAAPYDRLPPIAEKQVRPVVWSLSRQSAGLSVWFRTNSSYIRVRYEVSGEANRPHIPGTGAGGVDLYALDRNGSWRWSPGRYSFGDTITYRFLSLQHKSWQEYCLYLPYYSQVKWLEVGVAGTASLQPVPPDPEKPVVIYGTSITQGTAAPRPGLIWTNILGRRLHGPVVNLGFAGNGKLEGPVVRLMTELDARVYVLDCIPNLVGREDLIRQRLTESVRMLKEKRPDVPVLVVEDADAAVPTLNAARNEKMRKANAAQRAAFDALSASGMRGIYYLPADSIGLRAEDMAIDGVHPNAAGMERYALAYEKALRRIFHEPAGRYATMQPCTQSRDRSYDWRERHQALLKENREDPPRLVILGNSIVQRWGNSQAAPPRPGEDSWDKYLAPLGARNFGFSSDRIENVLWRVYHGELDGYSARQVVLMIGTNNIGGEPDTQIVAGMKLLISQIRKRQPAARLLVVGILPRRNESEVAALNRQIAKVCGSLGVPFADPGRRMLDSDGKRRDSLFLHGGVHPVAEGYRILGKALLPYLVK